MYSRRKERERSRSREISEYFKPGAQNSKLWDIYQLDLGQPIRPRKESSSRRKVLLSNLPLYTGMSEADLIEILEEKILPTGSIVNCQLNHADRTCVCEIDTVEHTVTLTKLEKIEILPGMNSKITRIGLSLFGDQQSIVFKKKIQTAIQAHTTVMAALGNIQHKQLAHTSKEEGESSLIRIVNTLPYLNIEQMTAQEWQDYHDDLKEELEKDGQIQWCRFVKKQEKGKRIIRKGDFLVKFKDRTMSKQARKKVDGRLFQGRTISAYFYPEHVFCESNDQQ